MAGTAEIDIVAVRLYYLPFWASHIPRVGKNLPANAGSMRSNDADAELCALEGMKSARGRVESGREPSSGCKHRRGVGVMTVGICVWGSSGGEGWAELGGWGISNRAV